MVRGNRRDTSESGFVFKSLERLISWFEKDRFTPLTAFVFLIVVGIIRSVSESLLFEFERTFSMYLIAQHTAFNFPVLILGSLVLSLAADAPLRKVYNTILPGFAIVTLPPFIDLIRGRIGAEHAGQYGYHAEGLTFIQKIGDIYPPNMLLAEEISTGLKIMVVTIMCLSGLYIAVKVRIDESIYLFAEKKFKKILKKVSAIFFGVFGIWVVVWFIVAIVPSVITFLGEGLDSRIVVFDYYTIYLEQLTEYYLFIGGYGYESHEISALAELMLLQQRALYITMFFFILSTILMIISMHLRYRYILKKIVSSLKATFILPLTVSALLGNGILRMIDPDFGQGWSLDPTFVLHFPYIFYIGAIGFFLGTFGCFVLDYYRENGILSKKSSKNMAIISLLVGGSFAFLMGPYLTSSIFIPTAILIYITFRIKNRDSEIVSGLYTFTYSLGCFLVYILGIYTPSVWKTKIYDEDIGELTVLNLSRRPDLSYEVLGFGIILMIVIFAAALIYHLLERGLLKEWVENSKQTLLIILLAISFLPGLIFNDLYDLIIFGTLGVSSVVLTDEEFSFMPVIIVSLILLYILLSLWELFPTI